MSAVTCGKIIIHNYARRSQISVHQTIDLRLQFVKIGLELEKKNLPYGLKVICNKNQLLTKKNRLTVYRKYEMHSSKIMRNKDKFLAYSFRTGNWLTIELLLGHII